MKQAPGNQRDQLPSVPSVLAQRQQMSTEPELRTLCSRHRPTTSNQILDLGFVSSEYPGLRSMICRMLGDPRNTRYNIRVGFGGRRRENKGCEDSVKTEQIPAACSTVTTGKLRGSKVVMARSKFQWGRGLR
ncbi:hypothetical protein L3X38_018147 [Prunus dulcis]|uniref:Uncharacterized protein n=1 Tax=Prunus dulcis TaxID=3755 RepID=A0AAD4ZAH1_PRUDU|nr:hypothetical protein L3X38_018147 [Prunus dulcis]